MKDTEPEDLIRAVRVAARGVLALVAEGPSNEELARRLFLSPLTTKTHVSRGTCRADQAPAGEVADALALTQWSIGLAGVVPARAARAPRAALTAVTVMAVATRTR